MDMKWAARTASKHPHLHDAFINVEGDWLDILLIDGRSFRFRPGHLIDTNLPLEEQRILLDKLISIGVANAELSKKVEKESHSVDHSAEKQDTYNTNDTRHTTPPLNTPVRPENSRHARQAFGETLTFPPLDLNDPDSVIEHLVPRVHSADFFLSSHNRAHDDSMVYIPLTPFLGAGLSIEGGNTSRPLFHSDIRKLGLTSNITDLFQAALAHIRSPFVSDDGSLTMRVELRPRQGAQIYEFTGPINYRCSWFLDVEIAHFTSMLPRQENSDIIPLFIPAQPDRLYIATADDPALPSFLNNLANTIDSAAPLYPLPHVVTDDGWSEWIPLPDHPAAPVLSRIRTLARARIYRIQNEAMTRWPEDFGKLMPYDPGLHNNDFSSYTRWTSGTVHGSVPETDFIIFAREKSPHPWENDKGESVLLRSRVARDVWHEGFSPMPNIWPPRWVINGFPDQAQFAALKEAADREI